ncbi:MAG: hypothetical protein OEZ51_03055 [Nitrospinota bacterium]|nr:hypothetical protein [Nitrospinota bacterium]
MVEKLWKKSGIILVVLLFQAGLALAEETLPKTGDPAWDTLSQVKKDWMLKLYDIVVEDRPELKPVADNSLEWHLKEMEYDTKKFQYMSEKHPDRIVRDKGLGAFSSLDWFPEFSEDLSSKDPEFAQLEKKVAQLKEELSSTKSFKALEDFISNLSKDEKHKETFKKFTSELARVQKILMRQDMEMSRNPR